MKILIVGGEAGGCGDGQTATARPRRLDEETEIIILERSGFVSYANCGLTYSSAKDPLNMAGYIMEIYWRAE